jgi:UDP-3-O-[3-hydroxymyristoyl] glucosamine N-acyltransferase
MITFPIKDIAAFVNGEITGNSDKSVSGLNTLDKATEDDITFIGSLKYAKNWPSSKAGAAIVSASITIDASDDRPLIKVSNADLAMAKLLEQFSPKPPSFSAEIHPTAVIDETAKIGEGSRVGAGCYIGKDVVIGNNVTLYPNVTIFDETKIGDATVIWSGTVIRERTEIGAQCILHNNVSIGADGFGYRPSDDGRGLVKIPHIGNVVIGNGVEIGANSCVDRAKFSSTILGDGCKIDNLVQIAHNCVLGRSCIMAGSSGLAGSVTLGDGVVIGGSASIKDHTTIHSGATVGAGSGVVGDVAAGKTVLGYPATDSREMLKQWVALRRLVR